MMKKEYLLTTGKERRRLELLSKVKKEEISLLEAATLMSISYRQALRVKKSILKKVMPESFIKTGARFQIERNRIFLNGR